MGVPVITLSGHHYVSRMSTAVLAGANLPNGLHQLSKNISIKPSSWLLNVSIYVILVKVSVGIYREVPLGDAASLSQALGEVWPTMLHQVSAPI